jgi:hypothetical protein
MQRGRERARAIGVIRAGWLVGRAGRTGGSTVVWQSSSVGDDLGAELGKVGCCAVL